MKSYLKTILPRLKQFSLSLDNRSLFVDHPWLRIDERDQRIIYIFRSDGNELLISRNGEVASWNWQRQTSTIMMSSPLSFCALQITSLVRPSWVKQRVLEMRRSHGLRTWLPRQKFNTQTDSFLPWRKCCIDMHQLMIQTLDNLCGPWIPKPRTRQMQY